jgi:hypothetical protein
MRFKMALMALVTFALLLTTAAWSKTVVRRSSEVIETVNVGHPMVVNGTSVAPGVYRMVAKGDRLRVENLNSHDLAAESPITWKRLENRVKTTKMDIDHDVLTRVNLAGTRDAVLLHRSR